MVFCGMQLLATQGSIVLDAPGQADIDKLKYCEIGGCTEGSHVVCTRYRPNDEMGPNCADGKTVDFTEDTKKYILDLVNGFRMVAARGEEKGKNDEPLPKAYLMNILEWGDELAYNAQVLADSCILRNDMCRATEQFHNPGQYGGFMRFSYPDWQFLSRKRPPTEKKLTIEKILHAINSVINGIYQFKRFATKALIEKHGERNIYMTLVHGWATHIGCAMSTYVDYHPADNAIFNILLFFCNFSHQPSAETYGGKVYETVDPNSTTTTTTTTITESTTTTLPTYPTDTTTKRTTTERTTTEPTTYPTDTTTEHTTTTPTYPTDTTLPDSIICNQVVAIMPIFQMDNAPREKLDELEPSSTGLRTDSMKPPNDYMRQLPRKTFNMKTTLRPLFWNEQYRHNYVTIRPRYFADTSTLVPPLTPHSISPETEIDDYFISLLKRLSFNNTQYEKNGFQHSTPYDSQRHHLRRHEYTIRNHQFHHTSITPWTTRSFITSHDQWFGLTVHKAYQSVAKKESIFLRAPRFQVPSVKCTSTNGLQRAFLTWLLRSGQVYGAYRNCQEHEIDINRMMKKGPRPALKNLPAKVACPFTPCSNPQYVKKIPMKKLSSTRPKAVISRRDFSHLANLVSDYTSNKRCMLDKLNNMNNAH